MPEIETTKIPDLPLEDTLTTDHLLVVHDEANDDQGADGSTLKSTIGDVVGLVTVPSSIDDLSDVALDSPSDGEVLTWDDGSFVNAVAAAGGPAYAIVTYTGGNITHFDNDNGQALAGVADLLIDAAAGDLLLCGISVICDGGDGPGTVDLLTIVDSAPVNRVSGKALGSSPAFGPTTREDSAPGWVNIELNPAGGTATDGAMSMQPYVVQAGDVENGQVRLRIFGQSQAPSVYAATATSPLKIWAINLGGLS